MAIAFRATASNQADASTTLSITKPTGTVDNDVLVAVISIADGTLTITPPAGWTTLGDKQVFGGGFRLAETFWKVAASEGSSYSFTFNSNVNNFGAIGSWSGCNTTTPINAHGGQTNDTASTSVTAPSITTNVANTQLIMCGVENATDTWTPPSGYTKEVDQSQTSSAMRLAMFDIANASSGATGAVVATIAVAHRSAGFLIALAPNLSSGRLVNGSLVNGLLLGSLAK